MKYQLKALSPQETQVASPGKYRVVTSDHFSPQQVGDEVDTVGEALLIWRNVSPDLLHVKIIDDKGEEIDLPREQPGSIQAWGGSQIGSVCDSGFRISRR